MIGSVSEWAKAQQITPQAANQRVRRLGIPRMPGGLIDFAVADSITGKSINPIQQARGLKQKSAMRNIAPGASHVPPNSLAEIQRAREQGKLDKEMLLLAQMRGTLVSSEEIEREHESRATAERDAWLGFPAQVAADIAAEFGVDARELQLRLERSVKDHLRERSRQ